MLTTISILDPQHPLHILLHHLDYLAAGLTCTSTVLLARHRRIGFLILATGAALWLGVAIASTFSGRHITGMVIGSCFTICAALYGWARWAR